jgi:hypothetical protein
VNGPIAKAPGHWLTDGHHRGADGTGGKVLASLLPPSISGLQAYVAGLDAKHNRRPRK